MATVNDRRRFALGMARQFYFDAPGGVASVPPHLRDKSAGGWFFGQALDPTGRYVLDDIHQGTPRTVQPGRCASSDGVDDRINVGSGSLIQLSSGNWTIAQWYTSSTANEGGFGSCGSAGWISSSSRFYYLGAWRNWVTGNPPINGSWNHYVVTFESGTLRRYINGVLTDTVTSVTGSYSNGGDVLLNGYGGNYFSGKQFDYRIYNRALTPEEIASIYATSKPGGRPDVALAAADLVGHWKLDDTVATKRDSSGNGYHGTQSGGVTIYTGNDVPFSWQNEVGYTDTAGDMIPQNSKVPSQNVLGATLQYAGPVPRNAKLIDSFCGTFDGVDDRGASGTAAIGPAATAMSFSAFVRQTARSGYQAIAGEWGSSGARRWIAYITAAGLVEVYVSDDGTLYKSVASTTAVTLSNWTCVAFTFSANTVKIYLDGTEATTTVTTARTVNALSSVAAFFRLGTSLNIEYFAGQISDARVYNSALSPTDVANLYAGKEITAQPVGHWPIQEGDGTTLYDVSGNGNHATLTGATLATFWGTRQSLNHRNLRKGFRYYYNLIKYSQDLSNAVWGKAGAGTISADAVAAPDGTNTADRLTASDTTFLYQSYPFVNGTTYTLSFWAKSASPVTIQYGTLIAGAALGQSTSTTTTSEWTRYVFTFTAASTPLNWFIQRLSGGTVLDLWGFQCVPGTSEKTYQMTLGAGQALIPAKNDGSGAADGNAITNPAGQYHNQAETRIDFTGGVPAAPWTEGLSVPTAYNYGDSPAALKKATQVVGGTELERDYYILLAE